MEFLHEKKKKKIKRPHLRFCKRNMTKVATQQLNEIKKAEIRKVGVLLRRKVSHIKSEIIPSKKEGHELWERKEREKLAHFFFLHNHFFILRGKEIGSSYCVSDDK